MLPPVPRCSGWASSSLISPDRFSLPQFGGRVGLHIDLFGACSAFTRVAACTLARSPIVTANRRLQPFRYLHDCSDCFRLERIAGWGLHPLESAAFARRTPNPAVCDLLPTRCKTPRRVVTLICPAGRPCASPAVRSSNTSGAIGQGQRRAIAGDRQPGVGSRTRPSSARASSSRLR